MKIRANGIGIEVEDSGPGAPGEQRPAVLLVMGLGMQLIEWPPALVQALLAAGYRVIRHDNRDVGLSQHFDELGKPNLLWAGIEYKLGLAPRAPYSVRDMALDALGVLDALGIARAHVVGVSMGGMIAQHMALAAPQRLLSLSSVSSSSGAKGLPPPTPEVTRVLLSHPSGRNAPAVVEHYVQLYQAIGSPAYPTPAAELRARMLRSVARSFHSVGTLRQMVAVMADISRATQLSRISTPTLVLHGRADPMVPYACAEDTARRIPGAQLVGIPGMGHDLPAALLAPLSSHLISHFQSAQPRANPL